MNAKIFLFMSAFLITKAGFAQEQQLSLSEALTLAQKENKQIQIKLLELKKAEEAIKEQRSFLQPAISANAGYIFYAERPVIFLRDQSSAEKVNAVQVGGRNATNVVVAGSYPILEPAQHSRIRMAEINTHLQKERASDLAGTILLEVAKTYYTIQFYQEQIKLFQQSLKRNEHALADSRLLLQQGKGLKTDTLRNYIDVQNLKGAIYSLEYKIRVELLHLQQLIGLKTATPIKLVDPLAEVPNTFASPPDSLIQFAIENRPDVKAQRLMIAYNKEEQRKMKAEFKPSLHAIAQYQLQSQSDKFSFWNYSVPRTSFVGIQLNVPVYSGRREKYRTTSAHYTMHQAVFALTDLKETIRVEINGLIEQMKDAAMQKKAQDKNVEAAQVHFSMTSDRYKHGMSNRLELADAEAVLTQARINQLHSVYVLKILELQLKKATGLLHGE